MDDPKALVANAGQQWLDETVDLPRDVAGASDADVLRMAAAWLDFYDQTWPIIGEQIEYPDLWADVEDRDGLQKLLRKMATRMEKKS